MLGVVDKVVQKYDEARIKNTDTALVSATAGNDTRKWIERARPRIRVPTTFPITHTPASSQPPPAATQTPVQIPAMILSPPPSSQARVRIPPLPTFLFLSPIRFRSLDLNLKPASLSIHFRPWCMTRRTSAS